MYLSKKRNGIYYIYYNQLNGKRTSKSTGTKFKAEALRYLSGFETIIKEKQKILVLPITLKKFKFEFIRYSETIHRIKHTKSLIASFNMLIIVYTS